MPCWFRTNLPINGGLYAQIAHMVQTSEGGRHAFLRSHPKAPDRPGSHRGVRRGADTGGDKRVASAETIPAISIDSATIVANGAAVQLTFTATCGAGDAGSVTATITQTIGVHVAQGTAATGFTCTGTPQQISALATANVNGAPFRPGNALIQASVGDCPGANCTGASVDEVLRLTK
jgi:hypothetical protein